MTDNTRGMPLSGATFGEMEALLAKFHEIGDSQRTKFQARLKNFHRLGFPFGFQSVKGKPSVYRPGDIVDLALALELTQLGLTPERVVSILRKNTFPTYQCITMAARSLLHDGAPRLPTLNTSDRFPRSRNSADTDADSAKPLSMFLYFDPAALDPLRDDVEGSDSAEATFFYGGIGIVQENLEAWTSTREVRRLSLVNVTTMLRAMATGLGAKRKAFFKEIESWADLRAYPGDAIKQYEASFPGRSGPELASEIAKNIGVPVFLIEEFMENRALRNSEEETEADNVGP